MTLPQPACHSGSTGVAARDAAAVRSVRIEPRGLALAAGGSHQFSAVVTADAGVDTSVRWSVRQPETATVSASGELRTCYPAGDVVLVAASRADPTKADSVVMAVRGTGVLPILVERIARRGSDQSVDADAISGAVDVHLRLRPDAFPCRGIARLEVRLVGMSRDTVLSDVAFDPMLRDDRSIVVPLTSVAGSDGGTALPDGAYELVARVHVGGMGGAVSPPAERRFRVQIANR